MFRTSRGEDLTLDVELPNLDDDAQGLGDDVPNLGDDVLMLSDTVLSVFTQFVHKRLSANHSDIGSEIKRLNSPPIAPKKRFGEECSSNSTTMS